ncbi:MAG TPA: hypothetical protein P5563_10765, partial [Saprospiraceae bacterium]|nr:hypothetical protein [Saprospiraceae bacterium]
QYDFLKRNDELTEEFIMKLTEEQQEIARSINRRTEFRVLSTDFIEKATWYLAAALVVLCIITSLMVGTGGEAPLMTQ